MRSALASERYAHAASIYVQRQPAARRQRERHVQRQRAERESEATELPPRGLAGPSAEAAETRGWSPLSRQRRARCGAARVGGRAAQRLYNVLLSQAAHRDLRGRAWRARAREYEDKYRSAEAQGAVGDVLAARATADHLNLELARERRRTKARKGG